MLKREVTKALKAIENCGDDTINELWEKWGLKNDDVDLAFMLNANFRSLEALESIKLLKPDLYRRCNPLLHDTVVLMGTRITTGFSYLRETQLRTCIDYSRAEDVMARKTLTSENYTALGWRALVLRPCSKPTETWPFSEELKLKLSKSVLFSTDALKYVVIGRDGLLKESDNRNYVPAKGEQFSIVWDGQKIPPAKGKEKKSAEKTRATQIIEWIIACGEKAVTNQEYQTVIEIAEQVSCEKV